MQSLLINILILILGFIALVKGSDLFVRAASSIAKKIGVSEFVIGLTLVAVGTSIPEFVSSVMASVKQQSDIVMGNVMGSNIANIGLIIGAAAAISVIKTREEMLRRDGYIMLLAAVLVYVFLINGVLSSYEALLFLLLYFAYIAFLFREVHGYEGEYGFKQFITYFFKLGYIRETIKTFSNRAGNSSSKSNEVETERLSRDLLVLAASGVAIVAGANYLIDRAVFFAEAANISKTLIGLTLVAVGTSLPELSVSFTAARKGFGDIAVANIIGSNIANIFLILGVSGLIFPIYVQETTLNYIAPFVIFMSILLMVFIRSHWELRRVEGVAFLILYMGFMAFLFTFQV
ncbi:MAG: calcium/sodium antiporter [Archaeoglobaceae archaeon]